MASRVSNVPSASEIPEDLLDPVNYEPMLDAVSLVPCGHTFSEKTAAELMNRRMVCPLGREDIQGHTPNYIVRNLASKAINKSEVNQAAAHKEGPSAKAVTHLERGKELYTQEKYEEAILAFIAALSLYPTYDKAEAFLHCALDAQKKHIPSEHPNPPPIASSLIASPFAGKLHSSTANSPFKTVSALDSPAPNPNSPIISSSALSLHSASGSHVIQTHSKTLTANPSSKTVSSDRSASTYASLPSLPSSALVSPSQGESLSSQTDSKISSASNPVTGAVPYAPYLEFALNRVGRGKALCKAVEEGREDVVRYLLTQDTDVNVADESKTPLRIACEKNSDRILRLLIGNGAQVDGEDGKTCLLFALEKGFREGAKILAENGAPMMEKQGPRPHKVSRDKETPCLPLQIVAKAGDTELLQVFLKTSNRVNGVKLDAHHIYSPSVLGGDFDFKTVGGHALLLACENGHLGVARLLLDAGVCLDSDYSGHSYAGYRRNLGDKAFMSVCEKRNESFISFLLERGIGLDNLIDKYGDGNGITLREYALKILDQRNFPKLYELIKKSPYKKTS